LINERSGIKKLCAAFTLFLTLGMNVQPQSGPIPGQLGSEILSLEQRLTRPGISASERHDILVHLARFRQLSGNIAGAAAYWLEAVAVNPNDDSALVSGAFCLAAIGEWERAALTLQPLLASGRRGPFVIQARYLDACLRTLFFSDASFLVALAVDPEFASIRPMIYYTIWQILTTNPGVSGAGSAEYWNLRLLSEFPNSPEARITGPQNGRASIRLVQNPLGLLFPGTLGGTSESSPAARPSASAQTAVPVPQAPPPASTRPAVVPQTAAPAGTRPAAVPQTRVVQTAVLQTGVFSRETNARNQANALQKVGFSPTISRKPVNGVEHWAVTVPAGHDPGKTMQDLKKAGFDSFLVR
jgi:cell division septation protein DedD